jgi:hypothetical protein
MQGVFYDNMYPPMILLLVVVLLSYTVCFRHQYPPYLYPKKKTKKTPNKNKNKHNFALGNRLDTMDTGSKSNGSRVHRINPRKNGKVHVINRVVYDKETLIAVPLSIMNGTYFIGTKVIVVVLLLLMMRQRRREGKQKHWK